MTTKEYELYIITIFQEQEVSTFSSTPQSPPTQSPWIKINDDDTELFASCCALKYRRILDNFNKKKLDNNRNSKPSP